MAVRQPPFPTPAARLPGRRLPLRLVVALVVSASFLLWVATTGGFALYAILLAGLTALTWAVWRWPIGTVIALLILLPLSRFISFILFYFVESSIVLRLSQLWKDAVLVALVLWVLHEAFTRRRMPKLYFLDILVVAYIVFSALFLLYPGRDVQVDFMGRFLGFRLDSLYLLAYFIGRGLNLQRHDLVRILQAFVAISVIIALVAFWQWLAPAEGNAFFAGLGYERFVAATGGVSGIEPIRSRSLAEGELPRAASLLMSDLGLAFYQLLVVPLAAALFFTLPKRSQQWAAGLFLMMMVATLAMTITRSAIIAASTAFLLLVFWSSSYVKATTFLLVGAALTLLFGMVFGFSGNVLRELFSLGEASAQAHGDAISAGLRFLQENPLGHGLGTAGPLSQRLDLFAAFIPESWYLQIAIEMGLATTLLFGVLLVLTVAKSFIISLKVTEPTLRIITLTVAGAGLGLMLVGLVLHVWEATLVAFLFWLFAGIAVRAPELEQSWMGTAVTSERI